MPWAAMTWPDAPARGDAHTTTDTPAQDPLFAPLTCGSPSYATMGPGGCTYTFRRREAPRPWRQAQGCGQQVTGGHGTPQRWCSQACRLAAHRSRHSSEAAALLGRLAGALGPEHGEELEQLAGLLGVTVELLA
jgi:hypothetical protein